MPELENEILEEETSKFESQNKIAEPNFIGTVARELNLKDFQAKTVLDLIAEGSTTPFIARYRKEATGDLDENVIRDIVSLREKQEKIWKLKNTAINTIDEMGKLTPELLENIKNALTLKEVEEIYKPYKSKRKTKAMVAIEKGFQVIADFIKNVDMSIYGMSKDTINRASTDLKFLISTKEFQELLKENKEEEIIEGSKEIISSEIVANSEIRNFLREYLEKKSNIVSKIKGEKVIAKLTENIRKDVHKFEIYSDFTINISKIKPYQILALNRGLNLKILTVKLKADKLEDNFLNNFDNDFTTEVGEIYLDSIKTGYKTLFKSVENEVMGMLSEIGEDDAIKVFQTNLSALLLTKPEYGKRILAFDPAYRTGCKIVVLDELANPIEFSKIFLHSANTAKILVKKLLEKHNIEIIIVGNGTASNETVELAQSLSELPIYIVNESGASVYSASKIAQEEFKDLDLTDRGTVSIARRFVDPLSELVKVPVGSIGVGMYQHDISEKKLEEKLGYVVEDTVNLVGINVNTASIYVLNHISGINKTVAKKIYKNRPYKNREQLKKVLSDTVYEQAIGFLRIPESDEKLDNTDIHPEQYNFAKYVIENQIFSIDKVPLEIRKDFTELTLNFVREAYSKIGEDPRVNSAHKKASKKVDADSIAIGDILDGTVRNVVAFGAFVDIGLKNDGLVHISQLADKFVSDPNEIVSVGEKVKVRLTDIDKIKGKIQLSMKDV
ncbi:MAG: Tex-like N-terminal domain-containing protein [Candidatus Gracilibacteria bacterium]|nr:Tex-like N-terminal domain-containing protein [Candidatus Gracilibacteria bacterium]